MGKHKLEDYFKERLGQHQEPIDKDALWDSLGLDEGAKRDRPVWFRLLGLGLIIVIGLGSYFYWQEEGRSAIEYTEIKNSQEGIFSSTTHREAEPVLKENGEVVVDNDEANELKPISISSTLEKEELGPLVSDDKFGKRELEASTISTLSEFRIERKGSVTAAATSSLPNKLRRNHLHKNKENQIRTQSTLISNLYDLGSTYPKLIHRDIFSHAIKDDYVTSPSQQRWSIGGYAMLFKTKRTLGALRSSIPLQNYLLEREASETALETFIVGGYMQRQLTSNAYLKLGLEYQSITERFQKASIVDTTFTENAVAFNAKVLKEALTFNNHRLISIPLSMGYIAGFGKWRIVTELSSIFTLNQSFEGLFLEAENTLTQNTDHFNTGLSLAGRVAVGVSYSYDDNWTFSFLPTYQQHFQSSTRSNTGYEQKYRLLGSQLTAQYGF